MAYRDAMNPFVLIVREQAAELGKLLHVLENAVEAEVSARYETYVAYENGRVPAPSLGDLEVARDEFITAAESYRRWAYGGLVSTILAWLCDILLFSCRTEHHSRYKLFLEDHGAELAGAREPFLLQILADFPPADDGLHKRLENWNELRNRLVHSFGIVWPVQLQRDLSDSLGLTFDGEGAVQLEASHCRALLSDATAVATDIISRLPEP